MSTVQYIILGVFILFAIAGVIVFAGFGGSGGADSGAITVSLWGSIPESVIKAISENINAGAPNAVKIEYTQIAPENFEAALVNAIADEAGPDMIIFPNNLLLKLQNKLSLIPWSYLSERTFKDTFVEAGEVFTTSEGAYALPFAIDPLVMYWNRDIFSSNGLAKPPTLWEDAAKISAKVSQISTNKTIQRSGLGLGEYQNISNAKEILFALAIQAGSGIIGRQGNEVVNNVLDTPAGFENPPFENALSFYTDFADPNSTKYSWNRSLPVSENLFLSGQLAMYIGFASDLSAIRAKNPNLNFDVSMLPQAKSATSESTYADVYGIGILKSSKNITNAVNATLLMVSVNAQKIISEVLNIPSVRRDLLATFPGTSYGDVFWQSALSAKSVLDPNPQQTSLFVKNMLESITSGKSSVHEALRDYSQQIDELLN